MSWDFHPFLTKNSAWTPYEQAKMVQEIFSFSRRYLPKCKKSVSTTKRTRVSVAVDHAYTCQHCNWQRQHIVNFLFYGKNEKLIVKVTKNLISNFRKLCVHNDVGCADTMLVYSLTTWTCTVIVVDYYVENDVSVVVDYADMCRHSLWLRRHGQWLRGHF